MDIKKASEYLGFKTKNKTSNELIAFNQSVIVMQNRASEFYKSQHNGKYDCDEVDKLIFERLFFYKDISFLDELVKMIKKEKKCRVENGTE